MHKHQQPFARLLKHMQLMGPMYELKLVDSMHELHELWCISSMSYAASAPWAMFPFVSRALYVGWWSQCHAHANTDFIPMPVLVAWAPLTLAKPDPHEERWHFKAKSWKEQESILVLGGEAYKNLRRKGGEKYRKVYLIWVAKHIENFDTKSEKSNKQCGF